FTSKISYLSFRHIGFPSKILFTISKYFISLVLVMECCNNVGCISQGFMVYKYRAEGFVYVKPPLS
ncbi:MAG: hypothetical protein QXX37_07170, partial [Ignisphaera sp.]